MNEVVGNSVDLMRLDVEANIFGRKTICIDSAGVVTGVYFIGTVSEIVIGIVNF